MLNREMRIETIRSEGLAAQSYFVASGDEAFVIDPRRDASVYVDLASSTNASIRYIFETHRNEDYVTGSLELQSLFPKAEICHSKETSFKFGDHSLEDGETFKLGKVTVTCINTPGHTDDSMCYAVSEAGAGSAPTTLFTGDTLFVNEVGRTDLVDIRKHAEMSRKLFGSLHEKVLKLPDDVTVYPGHGAGSVCGGDIGEEATTTIGFEKKNNRWLRYDEESFVEAKVNQKLTLASYFKHCERLNTIGPPLLSSLKSLRPMDSSELEEHLPNNEFRIVDTRTPQAFLSHHIPGSISLSISNMGLLAGWALRPSQSFSFVLANTDEGQEDQLQIASRYLYRIGFDGAVGYLNGGLNQWTNSGRNTTSIGSLSIDDLANQLKSSAVTLVDGREPHEYSSEHIEGALSFPLTGIEESNVAHLQGKHVAVICPSGFRSTTAASLLARKGITDISVPLGGIKEWKSKGYQMNWRV